MRINPARSQVLFAMTDVEMVAQLIQGTFPNYNQLIPADYNTKAMVDVDEFKRETQSVGLDVTYEPAARYPEVEPGVAPVPR